MDNTWKNIQLEQVRRGTSIFGFIPPEIGNVIYCDSTTRKEKGRFTFSSSQIYSIVAGLLMGLLAIVYFAFGDRIFIPIGLSVASIILIIAGFSKINFRGSDYFVGDKGFAKISFENDRQSITSCEVVRFDDVAYLFTHESVEYTRGRHGRTYSHTDCTFSFFGDQPDYSKAISLNRFVGTFKDNRAHFRDNPHRADKDYLFLKVVEDVWTKRFLYAHRGENTIYFPTIDENNDLYQCVTVYPNGIRVIDKSLRVVDFRFNEIKNVKLGKNNKLKIEHINHSQGFAGLIEKGDAAAIDYSKLANGKAMLTLLYTKAPYVTPPPPLSSPNQVAIIGFVTAIISLFMAFLQVIGPIFCVGSITLSIIGLRRRPRGLAIAGLCISFVSALIILIMCTNNLYEN